MKVVFLSNYFNHHQKPFCEEMYRLLGDGYAFIETAPMSGERKKLGWGENSIPTYVKRSWDGSSDKEELQQLVNEADAVIIGSATTSWIAERLRAGRLVFRYSEHPLKKGFEPLKYLPRLLLWRRRNFWSREPYMLCASGYTAGDYRKFGMYRGRTYKWGYFPETKTYGDPDALIAAKDPTQLLWCGRFLDWKHPDDAVAVVGRLRKEGYALSLHVIGCGDMEAQLRAAVEAQGLGDCVEFCGSMKPEQVREAMERAGIYLATSDRGEGWGAVVNEAMNSGCAVVASHAMGSVPFLVKDGENGCVYRSGDVEMLYEKVKALLDAPERQKQIGKQAYRTMTEVWSACVAAERFVVLAEKILAGEKRPLLYEDGPCSPAKTISERFKG